MAQMDKDEFVGLIKDTASETVKGVMEEREKGLVEAIDAKIKEAIGEVEKSRVVVGAEGMERDKKAGFKSFSHFCRDIAIADKTSGRKISKELGVWETFYTKAAGTPSQNVSDAEAGGYLVPEEFRNQLLNAVEETNDLMPRCTPVAMQSNSVKIPFVNGFDQSGGLVYGNMQWTWVDEEEDATPKSMKFGNISLNLKKVSGLAYISDEMLEDSPMSMEGILRRAFTEGLNFQMNNVIIRGSGVGQPLGLLSSPCLVSIAAETGQAASTILFENILKMYTRIADPGSAIFLANPNTLPQLATMSLAVGTGGIPVFLPAGGASGKPYATLFGIPLIFNRHCSSVGTVGDIILVNMDQYLLGMKAGNEGMKFDTSMHVAFVASQMAYRVTMRMDGQCWWKQALVPPVATADTISPIVAIATRS